MNVKTSREGIAHVPDAPMGRVLVQVVAEGWKRRALAGYTDRNKRSRCI